MSKGFKTKVIIVDETEHINQRAYEECCSNCPQAKKCHEDCSEDECEQYTEKINELTFKKMNGVWGGTNE